MCGQTEPSCLEPWTFIQYIGTKFGQSFNAVPSPDSTDVTATGTIANIITLSTDLQDINGDRCDVERLDIEYTLFFTEFLTLSSLKTDRKNEITFTGLASGTTYNYQINITEENDVIATFSGRVTTSKMYHLVLAYMTVIQLMSTEIRAALIFGRHIITIIL